MFIPTVIVKQDIETDAKEFIKFLYRWSQEKRELIVRTYPDLIGVVSQGEEAGQEYVSDFVRKQYRINQDQIEILVADMKTIIQREGHRVLETLGSVMEYSWPNDNINYIIIPTLLPFSPLQKNIFFFSLERFLRTKAISVAGNYGMTAVLAHEVSHFIFLDLLNSMPDTVKTKCDKTIIYFAKEILAPIVMNETRMNDVLSLSDYGGNPLLKHITIKHKGREENIVTFFQAEYTQKYLNEGTFKDFVLFLLETLLNIHQKIHERHVLWDANGSKILSDTELRKQYCEPIEI